MEIPAWTKPALYGAVAGAAAVAIVGFNWGGWVTQKTALQSSAAESAASVALALTPYCVAMSKTDPQAVTVLAELKAATGYNRRGIIEKSGWATPMGAEKPNSVLAGNCEAELGKTI
jgi:alpha/beta superfamily hydrolase